MSDPSSIPHSMQSAFNLSLIPIDPRMNSSIFSFSKFVFVIVENRYSISLISASSSALPISLNLI